MHEAARHEGGNVKRSQFRILKLVGGVIGLALLVGVEGSSGAAKKPCVDNLGDCPEYGCAEPGSAQAIMNQLKRNSKIDVSKAKTVTFVTMQKLQAAADPLVGQNHFLEAEDRELLKGLKVGKAKFSEGMAVKLA